MNLKIFGVSTGIVFCVVSSMAFHCYAAEAEPAKAVAPDSELIVGVNTERLFEALAVTPTKQGPFMDGQFVIYPAHLSDSKTVFGFCVSVYISREDAESAFNAMRFSIGRRPGTEEKSEKPIGDVFFGRLIPKTEDRPEESVCTLLRKNCIVAFGYPGKFANVLQLAERVDAALNNPDIAPKGPIVLVPNVTLSSPPTFPIGGSGIPVQISSSEPVIHKATSKNPLTNPCQ